MQFFCCFNAFTAIRTGLEQLEDEWIEFKTAHRVLAKRLMYEGSAQEFVDEGIGPNLEHAIEIVKELRKHRLPPISRRQNNDRYVAQLKDEERGLFRIDRELFFSDI